MTDLYIRPDTDPQPLPFDAYDDAGRIWTDLANSAEGRKATGWNKLAPARPPFDPATQALTWSGTAWVVSDLPTPEPNPDRFVDLSDRQFFQALATPPYGIITQAEALDAVKTGDIPPVMQAVIDQLPEDQVFPTAMILSGATSFERASPLVAIFGGSQGMDAAGIDEFWRFAATL